MKYICICLYLILSSYSILSLADDDIVKDYNRLEEKVYSQNPERLLFQELLDEISLLNNKAKSWSFDQKHKIAKFKGQLGHTAFASLFTNSDKAYASQITKMFLTEEEYKELEWPEIQLSEEQELVRRYYLNGEIEQLKTFLNMISLEYLLDSHEFNSEKEYRIFLNFVVKDSTEGIEAPMYEAISITADEVKILRKDLIDTYGNVEEQFKGISGQIDFLMKHRIDNHKMFTEFIYKLELSLSERELKALNWPTLFPSLIPESSTEEKASLLRAIRKIRQIKLVSPLKSVKKSSRK